MTDTTRTRKTPAERAEAEVTSLKGQVARATKRRDTAKAAYDREAELTADLEERLAHAQDHPALRSATEPTPETDA